MTHLSEHIPVFQNCMTVGEHVILGNSEDLGLHKHCLLPRSVDMMYNFPGCISLQEHELQQIWDRMPLHSFP
jgi:hypothetical protein